MQQHLLDQGVIYTDFESAVREYPEIVQKYFMKCISNADHKYAALHYAVWSKVFLISSGTSSQSSTRSASGLI